MWLLRATALRRWHRAIFLAALASSFSSARGDDKPQEQTSRAATAVCNWQTVSSGFPPPLFLSHSRQEQVAHRRQNQVAFQSQVAAAFVLIPGRSRSSWSSKQRFTRQSARECHQEQDFDTGLRRRVAQPEEFQLAGIQQYISGHQQVKSLTRQAVISFDRQALLVLHSQTIGPLLSCILEARKRCHGWSRSRGSFNHSSTLRAGGLPTGQAGDSTASSPMVAVVEAG